MGWAVKVTSDAACSPPDLVRRIFDYAGSLEGNRTYRNNLLFLIADEIQVDNMVDMAQRYLAIGRIVGDSGRMQEFNEEQRKRLKKMAEAAELEVRVSITKACRHLFYPSGDAPQREVRRRGDDRELDSGLLQYGGILHV